MRKLSCGRSIGPSSRKLVRLRALAVVLPLVPAMPTGETSLAPTALLPRCRAAPLQTNARSKAWFVKARRQPTRRTIQMRCASCNLTYNFRSQTQRKSVWILCWQATAPCPSCSTMIPETSLDCHSCKLAIPFCIVSGKHIVADDYTGAPPSSHNFLSSSSLWMVAP